MESSLLLTLQLLSETKKQEDNDTDLFAVISAILALLPDSDLQFYDGDEILTQYSFSDFRATFGLHRSTFDLLNGLYHRTQTDKLDHQAVGLTTQLLSTLWYCASTEPLTSIAMNFDMNETSFAHCIRNITSWINKDVQKIFLRWPKGKRLIQVQEAYKKQSNMQGVIGAIGSIQIGIKSQPEDHSYFKDESMQQAAILQVVTLPNFMFSSAHCASPDTGNVEEVFESSPICEIIDTDPSEFFGNDSKLIGGNVYSKPPWIAAPYIDRGYLTRDQKAFNKRHEKIQSILIKSLELLSKRFPRLQMVDLKKLEWVTDLAIACCVLHNICCLTEDEIVQFIEENEMSNSL